MQPNSVRTRHIDWQAARSRVEANARALEQSLVPTAARIEDVYRKRAIALAQLGERDASFTPGLPVLVFRLGEERYAIELKHLSELIPFGYCVPIPHAPAEFLGVVSVRGELRTVVNLRQLLSLPGEAENGSGFVLLLRQATGEEQIGIKIDSVQELRELRPEEITRAAAGRFTSGLAPGASSGPSTTLLHVDAVLQSVLLKHTSSREPSV